MLKAVDAGMSIPEASLAKARADLVVIDGDAMVMAGLADRVAAVYQSGRLTAGGL